MREVIFMIFIVILYLILSYLLGLSTAMLILSAVLFIMAVLFSYNEQYYNKYIMFTTPKRSKITNEKDEVFKEKDRKANIVSFYILSILLFVNGIIRVNDKSSRSLLTTKDFIIIAGIALSIGIVIYFVDNYFLKKSREHEEYMIKSVILGLLIVVILFITMTLFL
ncbi:hypothetical protein [Caloranaerobacter sp. DY30410]|uniref:hypothetical protein n=1 Tax=Caloranaerobacter sp. DY30410 TaxID=3238305 RepID=UPI003D007A53